MTQLAEVSENTKRGARGLILPASTAAGNPAENTLLPGTVAEWAILAYNADTLAVRNS